MKPVQRLLLLVTLSGLVAGCSHLRPVADTDPPPYQDAGEPGILDWLGQVFWPRSR